MTAEISIHALREESDPVKRRNHIRNCISIHALREESDGLTIKGAGAGRISIHALREESDPASPRWLQCRRNFYPRSP